MVIVRLFFVKCYNYIKSLLTPYVWAEGGVGPREADTDKESQ